MKKQETQVVCRSVFISGENTTTKNQLTKKWIELVNQLEKNKKNTTGKR